MEPGNVLRQCGGLAFSRGAPATPWTKDNLSNYCTCLPQGRQTAQRGDRQTDSPERKQTVQRGDRQARGETDSPEGRQTDRPKERQTAQRGVRQVRGETERQMKRGNATRHFTPFAKFN